MLITCRITVPDGWLSVTSAPYSLTAEAFSESSTTWRRKDVTNPFVEGTWTVDALRENVMENLDVWIRGESNRETADATEALRDALSQLHFGIEVTFDNQRYYYNCQVADVMVKTDVPLRFAKMAHVTAQIPRHPAFERTSV